MTAIDYLTPIMLYAARKRAKANASKDAIQKDYLKTPKIQELWKTLKSLDLNFKEGNKAKSLSE